ncbi:MAG: GNAT family N-acetyltransferase [Pyrinomonadaceae bacterium]
MNQPRAIPIIETERLALTLPPPSVAARLLAFAQDNREHLAPWSPPVPQGYETENFWRERLAAARREFAEDASLRLVLFRKSDGEGRVVGVCNFTYIMRGAFQACYLGYNLDRRDVGQGLMYEALNASIKYVFEELRLHRIMANYMPTNERSGRLLRRLGFTIEGYARDYLFIDGAWRDHILTCLTNHQLKVHDEP